jgi:hypothetical protein
MRVPDGYTEMIKEIAKVTAKYRFSYLKDQLEDELPHLPDEGHVFNATVYLCRNNDDFKEDAPIPIPTDEQLKTLPLHDWASVAWALEYIREHPRMTATEMRELLGKAGGR